MRTADGSPISVPDITGVNVKSQGSNLPLDAYPILFRAGIDALDINPDYFADGASFRARR